ncbi:MAG: TIGR02206 family membrane protein [Phycisphaeraceae bacterium]
MNDATAHLDTFHHWSLVHWTVIAVTIVIAGSLAAWRHAWRGQPRARTLDRTLALAVAAAWIITNTWQLLRPGRQLVSSLPIHYSDLILAAVAVALWSTWRWPRTLVYFWGLAFGTLVFITPDLRDGPTRIGFWFFWSGHVIITAGVAYEVMGRDYRPAWRDWALAVGLAVAYIAAVLPLNAMTGYSYGYVGPDRPSQPALLTLMGPWPLRVLPMILLGTLVMALLVLPWRFGRRR